MLFQTYTFIIFFAVTYLVYLGLRGTRFWVHWLLLASYFFYGWCNPLYVGLIAYSTILDYGVLAGMQRGRHRKLWLSVSILNNLGLLGFFKYAGFVTDNINALFGALGSSYLLPEPGMLLPIGLSFYTFKSISYVVDCYRGDIERERNIFKHGLFVSFFPLLLAGPIERASNFLPQLQKKPELSGQHVSDGVSLFVIGLFKKVALADFLALYVNQVYDSPHKYGACAMLLATYAFAWQIYFDFSGYTDMARGVARAMGFKVMLNFNHPYIAQGLGEFWRRWHISLSTWFRDYVYIPLGGNRNGTFCLYQNIVVTMVVSGLWHGASWNFAMWGGVNGLGRLMTLEMEGAEWYKKIPKILKQLWVFHFLCFTWVFFRAATFADAAYILRTMVLGPFSNPMFPVIALVAVALVWLYQGLAESGFKRYLGMPAVKIAMAFGMIMYMLFFARSAGEAFIYFQF